MSAAYGTDEGEGRGFRAAPRADQARRFRAAQRHSRRVRFLKLGLPVAAAIGCLILALAAFFNPLRMLTTLPISVDDVIVSGSKIKMENPKLSGYTRDSRRYDVSAGAAAQDLTRPGTIELQEISAMLEMQEKTTLRLVAQDGLFDTKKEQLTLERNIVVTSSNGYEGYLEVAVVDTRNGNVVSEKPVRLKMLNGTVTGNRFELLNSGDVIRLDRGVKVNMRLDNPSGAAPVKP